MLSDDLIYLRKLEITDLERSWTWVNDPEVYLKIGSHVPVSKSGQLKWFERADQATNKVIFAICLKENDIHVGNVSLDNIETRHRSAQLAVFIGDTGQRGKSLGSRALGLLTGYAFDFLNLNRLWCKTTSCDNRVTRFYENLGFKNEGVMRQHEFINGQYVDKTIFGLLRAEFAPGRRAG